MAGSQPGRIAKAPNYLTRITGGPMSTQGDLAFRAAVAGESHSMGQLRTAAQCGACGTGDVLRGTTLQVACVYGDLTGELSRRVEAGGGRLDIVDVLPMQLENLRHKLPPGAPARLLAMDSAISSFRTQVTIARCCFSCCTSSPASIASGR